MKDAKPHPVLSLVTTVGALADAQRLAGLLLERRLAACVQIEPGLVSHYVWQGRVREEPELRLTIKTLPDRVAALQALFAEHHPYELPQFLSTVMDASDAYAAWVSETLAGASA
jgi:periplasmic divalent cation tolerance protein